MADDDDALGSVGPEEIFAPSGPRRSNFTPPTSDAESLEAASNLFNDDAIAAALAAELAKVASGPIPIVRPADGPPPPTAGGADAPKQPDVAPAVVAAPPAAPAPPSPFDQAAPSGLSFELPPPFEAPAASEPVAAHFDTPVSSVPDFAPPAPTFDAPAYAAPEPAPAPPTFEPSEPTPAQPDSEPYGDAGSADPDRALYLSAPAPTVPPADAPPPPGYESTPRYVPSPAPAPSPFDSLFDPPVAPGAVEAPVADAPPLEAEPPAAVPAAPNPFEPPTAAPAAAAPAPSPFDSLFDPPTAPVPEASPFDSLFDAPAATGPVSPPPAAPASPDQPPHRRSLPDDQLLQSLRDDGNGRDGTLSAIEQLQSQLEMRAREAREYAAWEQSMVALGTPDAAAALEQARAEFAGVVGSAPAPSSASAPPASVPLASVPSAPPAFAPAPLAPDPSAAVSSPAPQPEPPAFESTPHPASSFSPPSAPSAPDVPPAPVESSEPSLEGTAFADLLGNDFGGAPTPAELPNEAPVADASFPPPPEATSEFATLAPPTEQPFAGYTAPADSHDPTYGAPADEDPYDPAPPWDISVPADAAPIDPPAPAQADSPVFLEPPTLIEPFGEPARSEPAPPEPVFPETLLPEPVFHEPAPVEQQPAQELPVQPPAVAQQPVEPPPWGIQAQPEADPAPFAWQLPTVTPETVTPPPAEPAPVSEPVSPGAGVFDNLLVGGEEDPRVDAPSTWLPPEPSSSADPNPPAGPPAAEPPADPGEGAKRPFGEGVERDNAVDPSDSIFGASLGPVSVNTAGVAVLTGSISLPSTPILIHRDVPLEPENAPVRPRVFAPELAGQEPTVVEERIGRAARLFWLWFAANSSLVAVVFGGMIFTLGMSLRQAIVATLAGVAVSFLPLGLGTLAGKRSGQPTMVVSRATFGIVGNILPAAIALVSRLFWGAALLWILSAGGTSILTGAKLAGSLAPSQLTVVLMVAGFALATVIAYFGYTLIAKVQLVVSVVSGIFVLGFIGLTFTNINVPTALTTGDGSWLLLLTGAVLVFSFVGLLWANSSSDLARYQRVGSSGASSMLWATFGTALPTFILIAYGALLAASNPLIASGIASDPMTTLGRLLPTWYPLPLLAATVLSLLSGTVVSMYSGGFALQAIGLRLQRRYSTLIVGVLVLLIAVVLTMSITDFTQLFRDFATTLAVPVAAWAGMFAAEMMIRNRRFDSVSLVKRGGVYADARWPNLAALVVITVVGLGLTTATVPGLTWEGYLFAALGVPLSGDLATTDLGVFVALVVGLLFPIVAGIPAIRRQESAERPAE